MSIDERAKAIIGEILTSKLTLAEDTKKERKYLLVFSLLIIAIIWIGIVPTKITAIGVEFSLAEQKKVLVILGLINFYYLIGFVINGIKDYYVWNTNETYFYITDLGVSLNALKDEIKVSVGDNPQLIQSVMQEKSIRSIANIDAIDFIYNKRKLIIMRYIKFRRILNYIFLIYNLAFPLLLGIIANYLLIRKLIEMLFPK